ncbi:MAG TPA: dipeptidase [Thermomicrobiales bacterium]|nr:dipeptidase [Thermomicrobiales bacterium]
MTAAATDLTERAAALHRDAIIVDGHSDILMAIADRKMRLRDRVELPDPTTWRPPLGWTDSDETKLYNFSPHTAYFQTMGHYDIPRFLEGGLTAQACAVFLESAHLDRPLHRTLEMIYWLRREAAENSEFALIERVADFQAIKQAGKTAGFLTFEGFEPLESDLKLLDIFYDLGLRMASLTHSRRNFFADGTQMGVKTGGLSEPGQDAVRRMNELGIVVDLAHLNTVGCWDVLKLSEAPVVLSHTSPSKYFPDDPPASPMYPDIVDDRSRALLDAIAANGGVVGIIAYNQPDLDAYVDDIDYVIRAVGPDHVGLGTDFFGVERAPKGFATMAELPNLTAKLVERGYADDVILKILGGNYLRVFAQVWA